MSEADDPRIFERSLERCLADPLFLERFYARLLLSSEDVAKKFAHVDMQRQQRLLRTSLYHVLRAAQGYPDGRQHLEEIASTHSERGYDIRPEHYRTWLECLVQVAREADRDFDARVELAWRSTLGECIDLMLARYQPPAL